jgi:transglutaminase-like putative cysteine protease
MSHVVDAVIVCCSFAGYAVAGKVSDALPSKNPKPGMYGTIGWFINPADSTTMLIDLSGRDGVITGLSIPLRGMILGTASAVLLLVPMIASATEGQPPSRSFELTYKATVRGIPDGSKVLDLWLPVPQTDRNQSVHRITIDAPNPISIGQEARFGNQCLHVRVDTPKAPVVVSLVIEATRRENSGSVELLSDEERAEYLRPEPLVPLDGPIRALALEATRGLETDTEKARAVYEKVVGLMKYDKSGTGWGRGDALFACDAKRGNCTDFHALVIGMARSVGVPARFAIGLPLPKGSGSGEINGYHCWAELYVQGRGWVPVDASEAAKDSTRRSYFFGHHDEDRLEFSRGRHLTLVPAQQGPPLNFFIDPYAEVDGRPHEAIDRKITFTSRDRTSLDPGGRR